MPCSTAALLLTRINKQENLENFKRAKGIEPSSRPWQGRILPLDHARVLTQNIIFPLFRQFRTISREIIGLALRSLRNFIDPMIAQLPQLFYKSRR